MAMSDPFAVSGGNSGGEQRNEEDEDVGLGKALSCPYIYTIKVSHLFSKYVLPWILLGK